MRGWLKNLGGGGVGELGGEASPPVDETLICMHFWLFTSMNVSYNVLIHSKRTLVFILWWPGLDLLHA